MKIRIDSYKNIHDLTIPVVNNKLILLGANGVGKTNTLDAVFFNKCAFEDAPYEYDRRFLLSMNVLENADEYYPNSRLMHELFPNITMENAQEVMMNFLEKVYLRLERPALRKLVRDALETLKYAIEAKRFDPSPLAITRLVILNKIYDNAVRNNTHHIILVDTPELYAHPLLMDEIVSLLLALQQAGCLIIVSTHSEHVVSRFFTRFEEIVKLEKTAEGQMIANIINMQVIMERIREFYDQDEYLKHNFSRSSHMDEGLVKLLDNDLESYLITAFRDHIINIFFSQSMILGEGASEDVLFDYIENIINPTWVNEYQVGFINCMGKSTMPLYFIFLNSINVRTFVMYDLDNEQNPVHAAYHRCFDEYHFKHRHLFASYYLAPDLERYLNFNNGERIESIIKPVNIFNYTFLREKENPQVRKLIDIMEENIRKMIEAE